MENGLYRRTNGYRNPSLEVIVIMQVRVNGGLDYSDGSANMKGKGSGDIWVVQW